MTTGKATGALTAVQLHFVLLCACIVLTGVLYLNGGATSPFVSLFLVPIAISAARLSGRFTVALATFCLLAYSGLMFYYQPLQFLSPNHEVASSADHHSMHTTANRDVSWHVVGMWMNFVISTLLITYFVLRMARALRVQATELAAIRERQLRDEHVLGIATLAAGTLHELSTPLATMTLLVEDLKISAKDTPAVTEDAKLLGGQLDRCKFILENLARAAQQQADKFERLPTREYLNRVLANWSLLQPGIPLLTHFEPLNGHICVDSTLEQAIINLLNNAAEASPGGIEISTQENTPANELAICIRDHGPGVSLDAESIGKPFVSTRGSGRGLGLFLSNATVERLGGEVMLKSHPGGGTVTTLTLPLA